MSRRRSPISASLSNLTVSWKDTAQAVKGREQLTYPSSTVLELNPLSTEAPCEVSGAHFFVKASERPNVTPLPTDSSHQRL
jgi:hypothetical protein